jgi:hypothetical protein
MFQILIDSLKDEKNDAFKLSTIISLSSFYQPFSYISKSNFADFAVFEKNLIF